MMFIFLDNMNPKLFMLKTKFGTVPHYEREGTYAIADEKRSQVNKLCDYFSCHYVDALAIYDKWLSTKPIYVRVKNSTNKSVYVPESRVDNTQTNLDCIIIHPSLS